MLRCVCVFVCGRPDIVASVLVDVISSKQMHVYLRAYAPLSMYIYRNINGILLISLTLD